MTVALVQKSPCTVKYGGATIGQTEGDVVFKYKPEWRLFRPDQSLGPQSAFITSEQIEVTIPLVPRADVYDIVRAHMFAAGLIKGTPKVSSPLATTLGAAEAAGQTVLTVAAETNATAGDVIIINRGAANAEVRVVASATTGEVTITEPLAFDHASGESVDELDADPKLRVGLGNNRSNIGFAELLIDPVDGSPDIKLYKAFCNSEIEYAYKKEEETIIELTYVALEDTSRANGDRMASIGDTTVT